jgi:hypothetical protein
VSSATKGSQGPGLGPPGNVHVCTTMQWRARLLRRAGTRMPVARPRRWFGAAAHGKATQRTKKRDGTYARVE